ncbi:di-trans,poly-cis-decaprenylcistransferase [Malacoplasma penetrans]|uniref:Isoprenyl transferase n=1 Tax=Malacoplasma penetrans (strain HF-2) TaxID=272633 RepID=Q8EUH1_MALP2|nr:polyprenyl diphosphate synthase [Malacoplasma penetrans]RXY96075.1 di-trans,poly-cis-decaprenylcistransferase [Malacoplasma penetrans]BAC44742.1 undecaprenyl diphosphate synthase [Malacoplasma penetrans HF-2]
MNKLKHIAFIMDGNGRWAKVRNKSRTYGHSQGIKNLLEIVQCCIEKEIEQVSFFAFSMENWKRGKEEVNFLLNLLLKNLNGKLLNKMEDLGIVGKWIGFENNLPRTLVTTLKKIESQSSKFEKKIQVNLFFNYSGTLEILEALKDAQLDKEKMKPVEEYLITHSLLPIDLLIRTSGEQRLSNFCLFNLAYSEIIFEPKYWPDYNRETLLDNIEQYYQRDRRFGKA